MAHKTEGKVIHREIAALATDFDGTIRTTGGSVPADLLAQLQGLRRQGIKLILATGRAFQDLRQLVDITIFDALVVENGAIVIVGGTERNLAPGGWEAKRESLSRLFKTTGHEKVLIALRREMLNEVKVAIDDQVGLEFNKEALMLSPRSVNKGAGLKVALELLGVDPSQVLAIGDGENDLSMFLVAGLSIAVKNAVPVLAKEADYVTEEASGKGVSEAIAKFCGPLN